MSLKNKTEAAIASLGTFQATPRLLHVVDDRRKLSCRFTSLETVACEFDDLTLVSDELSGLAVEELKQMSDHLASRMTYLLETICPVEIDQEHASVQLRSNPPKKNDDGTTYYELIVKRGGMLRLCRYQKQPGEQRQTIPAQVTREVLLRLVADFESVLIDRPKK